MANIVLRMSICKQTTGILLANTSQIRAFADSGKVPPQVKGLSSTDNSFFASSRSRDLSSGEVVCQLGSVFGASCMNDQLSVGTTQSEGLPNQMESYECVAAVSLHSVMQSNVPQPYAPVNERKVPTHLNMPGSGWRQKEKFTAGDLQQSLHHDFYSQTLPTKQEWRKVNNLCVIVFPNIRT